MSHNLSPEWIVWICIFAFVGGLWLSALIESIKAKAFNDGYKRGRASNSYVRESTK